MKERVPDSTGLPLRAMVMVLLFLGVIFLLLGWQALSSSGKSDDDSASAASSATSSSSSASTSASPKPAATDADVHVFNISGKEGVAGHTADQLKAGGFKVIDVGNLSLPEVTVTTVYFTDADGEHATADAVGKNLGVPVEPRLPALSGEPPGVIVLVAG
ncbi:LytR C-terminal domain-containing protein [Mycobacterium sp. Aquia_213]|uniref:LytR C-terminal domain-containing protein n=1 Tax=Mycobacterium sp. Aquia_213 TaxID=2991728 RepID=UPI00226F67EB|nr:LytR C-terminal domain-containing protein [Mycobacterium sp. Aquia_213]WAC91039.1 LytR C-terminal domain-containing protein [Mycobacterium sp. Aquia_213]